MPKYRFAITLLIFKSSLIVHVSIVINYACKTSFYGEKSIPPGAPCPCIVIPGAGA